jgi:hypothetical protein
MSIFNRKKRVIGTYMGEPVKDESIGVDYEEVLSFLASVNQADFDKIIKVARIYRDADIAVAKVTGLKTEQVPSIFETNKITDHKHAEKVAKSLLDEDDELEAAFLDDDEPVPPNKSKAGKGNKAG